MGMVSAHRDLTLFLHNIVGPLGMGRGLLCLPRGSAHSIPLFARVYLLRGIGLPRQERPESLASCGFLLESESAAHLNGTSAAGTEYLPKPVGWLAEGEGLYWLYSVESEIAVKQIRDVKCVEELTKHRESIAFLEAEIFRDAEVLAENGRPEAVVRRQDQLWNRYAIARLLTSPSLVEFSNGFLQIRLAAALIEAVVPDVRNRLGNREGCITCAVEINAADSGRDWCR